MKTYTLSEIKAIVSRLARQYGAERIYLFGSYARGDKMCIRDSPHGGRHTFQFDSAGVADGISADSTADVVAQLTG